MTPSQCLYCSLNSLCFQSMVSEPQTRTFTLISTLSLFIFHLCFTGLWFTLSSTPSLFSSSGSRASNSEFHSEFNAFLCVFSRYGCRSSTLHFRAEINALYVYYSSNRSWASTMDFHVEHNAFSVHLQAIVTVL